jgi:RTX calcium-binding nonapeptide repeat (4 copies)
MVPRSAGRARLDAMKALAVAALGLTLVLLPSVAAAEHIRGTADNETLVGTPKRDWIEARDGADEVRGRGGNDLLTGGPGDDWVRGGRGNDEIEDDRGRDLLIGGPGRDSIDGRRGIDELVGGPGNDYLADYLGGDTMRAGAGDDRSTVASRGRTRPYPPTRLDLGPGDDEVLLDPDGRRDVIDCGPGNDLVEFLETLDPHDELISCETVREYQGK